VEYFPSNCFLIKDLSRLDQINVGFRSFAACPEHNILRYFWLSIIVLTFLSQIKKKKKNIFVTHRMMHIVKVT
jgi:hypothetical protein